MRATSQSCRRFRRERNESHEKLGLALIALGLLYSAIPGGWHEIVARHGGFGVSDFLSTGLDPAKTGWEKWKGMFEIEYTIFAGLIGSTFITMATHGTDQDMVQRMLTAPDIRRSRRSLMLSGLADSDTGQAHARELLAVAASDRA